MLAVLGRDRYVNGSSSHDSTLPKAHPCCPEAPGPSRVVGHQDGRQRQVRHHVLKKGLDPASCLSVQVGGRFIQEDDFRLVEEGAGYGDTLRLPARKAIRRAIFESCQPEAVEESHQLRPVHLLSPQGRSPRHIVCHGPFDQGWLLGNEPHALAKDSWRQRTVVFSIEEDGARGGLVEPVKEAEER